MIFNSLISPEDDYPIPIDRKSCSLLGPTALVVQGLMGILVILSLVYKRHRETNKRPWKIWMFDVSKQVIGQAFVHLFNLVISGLGSVHSSLGGNACVYYFFNVLIDTTFGVAVIYGLLHLINYILITCLHLKGFQSGQYDSPPRITYWLRQAVVYVAVLSMMKLLVVGLFALWPGLLDIGAWLLRWTGDSGNLQVIFVMGIFPIIMNVIQFWIIDSIVKSGVVPPSLPIIASADDEAQVPFFHAESEDGDAEEEEVLRRSNDLESARDKLETTDVKSAGSATPSGDHERS